MECVSFLSRNAERQKLQAIKRARFFTFEICGGTDPGRSGKNSIALKYCEVANATMGPSAQAFMNPLAEVIPTIISLFIIAEIASASSLPGFQYHLDSPSGE